MANLGKRLCGVENAIPREVVLVSTMKARTGLEVIAVELEDIQRSTRLGLEIPMEERLPKNDKIIFTNTPQKIIINFFD